MRRNRYDYQIGISKIEHLAPQMPPEGAPMAEWCARAGVDIEYGPDIMRHLRNAAVVEPVPGRPELYRHIPDFGRHHG